MKLSQSFLMLLFLLQINHCSAMEIEVRPVAMLACAAGMYAWYENAESDRQLRRPFNAGMGTSLMLAGVMKVIEAGTTIFLQTDMFSLTPLAQALKIAAAIGAATGACHYVGVYKHLQRNPYTRGWAYCKGLLCGGFLVLPFCSDL